ncbi:MULTISPECIES: hypothetical protein [Paenibacillus]|uniref:hypothetical protein n=1 Tax=Paenibacillus TaxID=44249 RepID=UPI0013E0E841|nr:hypothetical protein [Paenibacillus whitsoniae]
MKTEQLNSFIDSVLPEVVLQTYGNISLPSDEQIQQSMKKMMFMLESKQKWNMRNE